MSDHRVYLDESSNDGAWQAVCEGCNWTSRWVHFDEFYETDDPADAGGDHAAELGQQHTAAMTGAGE